MDVTIERAREERALGPFVPELLVLLVAFVFGFLIAFPAEYLLGTTSSFIVGFIEEPAKQVGLVVLAISFPLIFKDKKKALQLGALAGVGFAFCEDLANYFVGAQILNATGQTAAGNQEIFARIVISLPGHVMWASIAAFGTALAALRFSNYSKRSVSNFLYAYAKKDSLFFLVSAAVLHTVYDLVPFLLQIFLLVISAVLMYGFYKQLPDDLRTFKFEGARDFLKSSIRQVREARRPEVKFTKPVEISQPSSDVSLGAVYCPRLGHKNSADSTFCGLCGDRLVKSE